MEWNETEGMWTPLSGPFTSSWLLRVMRVAVETLEARDREADGEERHLERSAGLYEARARYRGVERSANRRETELRGVSLFESLAQHRDRRTMSQFFSSPFPFVFLAPRPSSLSLPS